MYPKTLVAELRATLLLRSSLSWLLFKTACDNHSLKCVSYSRRTVAELLVMLYREEACQTLLPSIQTVLEEYCHGKCCLAVKGRKPFHLNVEEYYARSEF